MDGANKSWLLDVPLVSSCSLLQKIMIGPLGHRFLRDAHAADRSVFVWTVNDTGMMRWSIRRGVDGVLTDDPKKFLDVCREFREDVFIEEDRLTVRQYLGIAGFNIMAIVFSFLFYLRHGLRDQMRGMAVVKSKLVENGNGTASGPKDGKWEEGKGEDRDGR
ncbi:hypothetical protein GP486_003888 [Trichoglossum hirsutum]|uniref:GP-PDE domain-containing protein n=1 Tax=Trichoglossum hirsutum TaxID=265104 RepID=A0A9P8LC28_9PEZI|nr:hypothetical protein GP486_003888 [Trichoglossum hirsutum]